MIYQPIIHSTQNLIHTSGILIHVLGPPKFESKLIPGSNFCSIIIQLSLLVTSHHLLAAVYRVDMLWWLIYRFWRVLSSIFFFFFFPTDDVANKSNTLQVEHKLAKICLPLRSWCDMVMQITNTLIFFLFNMLHTNRTN